MPTPLIIESPDPLEVQFFDDFIGAAYDNKVWGVQPSGGGTVTSRNLDGGRLRIRAPAGVSSFQFYMNEIGCFSTAKFAEVTWSASLQPVAGDGVAEVGIEAAVSYNTDWICWHYKPGSWTNFQCQCGYNGNVTTTDSGVAGDTNMHEFTIRVSPTNVQFYLDGVLRANVTTNIYSGNLQPYGWVVASSTDNSDIIADYVRITGDR